MSVSLRGLYIAILISCFAVSAATAGTATITYDVLGRVVRTDYTNVDQLVRNVAGDYATNYYYDPCWNTVTYTPTSTIVYDPTNTAWASNGYWAPGFYGTGDGLEIYKSA